MGRPYESELAELPSTYAWALNEPVVALSHMIEACSSAPALCIGSGGSYSAAVLCAELIESVTSSIAVARTPLEMEAAPPPPSTSIWLISASGRNADIRRSLRIAAQQTAAPIRIVCAKTDSPLERDAHRLGIKSVFSFDSPAGKDGFLATNSLLATCVLLTRAAQDLLKHTKPLPGTLALLRSSTTGVGSLSDIGGAMASSMYNIVLHGPSGRAGAVDLESKFTEAAIAPLSATDYRNFAHGRHNWLNRFGRETHVLALLARDEERLATKTMGLLPDYVRQAAITLPADFHHARLASLLLAIDLTGFGGLQLELDPGRPKIPDYGRKLYNVRVGLTRPTPTPPAIPAVQRKLIAAGLAQSASNALRQMFAQAHSDFVCRLTQASLRALIFDYDGTLVNIEERANPPGAEIAAHLNRLLAAGIKIGIATGRGNSITRHLRKVIDRSQYKSVLIGYHNGAVIARLDGRAPVDGDEGPVSESLKKFRDAIEAKQSFLAIDNVRSYSHQISLRGSSGPEMHGIWVIANELVADCDLRDLKVRISGHSVDVLDEHISKKAVIDQLHVDLDASSDEILCIGDSGHWPGNDLELLSAPLSLSVDSVSANPNSCWNLLPSRIANVRGTIHYLQQVGVEGGAGQFTP